MTRFYEKIKHYLCQADLVLERILLPNFVLGAAHTKNYPIDSKLEFDRDKLSGLPKKNVKENQQLIDQDKQPPQLPKLPTSAIDTEEGLQAKTQRWFEYPVKAQPHHTDYAGIVWHGTYLTWMEEARVEYLRSIGIEFADLVALGCDLPVVELSLRYHLPVRLGVSAIVKARLSDSKGVRMNWDYEIQSLDRKELFLTGKVVLVGVDREKGKIMRQLPSQVQDALIKHTTV